jgi:hypothetical protein
VAVWAHTQPGRLIFIDGSPTKFFIFVAKLCGGGQPSFIVTVIRAHHGMTDLVPKHLPRLFYGMQLNQVLAQTDAPVGVIAKACPALARVEHKTPL